MEIENIEKSMRKRLFSVVALILSIIALGFALTPKIHYALMDKPQQAQVSIGELTISVQDQQTQQNQQLHTKMLYASYIFATLAFLSCIFAFIKREEMRVYIGALVVIAVTVLWNLL